MKKLLDKLKSRTRSQEGIKTSCGIRFKQLESNDGSAMKFRTFKKNGEKIPTEQDTGFHIRGGIDRCSKSFCDVLLV